MEQRSTGPRPMPVIGKRVRGMSTLVHNVYSSINESAVEFLQDNSDFIKANLGVSSLDDVVRLNTNTLAEDFNKIIFSKLFFDNTVDVKIGVVNPVVDLVAKDLGEITSPGTLNFNRVRFATSKNSGLDSINSPSYMVASTFKSINCPFVMYEEAFATADGADEVSEMLMSKKDVSRFAKYLQMAVNSVGKIMVNAMGQRAYGIKPISWDNLIIDDAVRFMVKDDLELFLKNEDWFAERQLPYRRGYLFHGPPGNGKSTMIRAMLTHARIPAYTIKRMWDEDSAYYFEDMFETAASQGRAFIILEDIDRAFVSKGDGNKDSDSNRIPLSLLLNCLDGIAESDGLIVIATANNPEVLDKAILSRPGRFDRVVPFPNPGPDLITQYFDRFKLDKADEKFAQLIEKCTDFSFAQLRETYILGAQIALTGGLEITPSHLIEACDKVSEYNKKAGVKKSAGFARV